jgi:hypothetical protein
MHMTWSIDMQHWHAAWVVAWTCRTWHGHEACTCSIRIQNGYVWSTSSIDKQHGHATRTAVWTCNMKKNSMPCSMDMQRRPELWTMDMQRVCISRSRQNISRQHAHFRTTWFNFVGYPSYVAELQCQNTIFENIFGSSAIKLQTCEKIIQNYRYAVAV